MWQLSFPLKKQLPFTGQRSSFKMAKRGEGEEEEKRGEERRRRRKEGGKKEERNLQLSI